MADYLLIVGLFGAGFLAGCLWAGRPHSDENKSPQKSEG
jgi:hypothetical protein